MGGKWITEEEHNEIIDLYMNDMNTRDIADKYGVSTELVRRHLKEAGVFGVVPKYKIDRFDRDWDAIGFKLNPNAKKEEEEQDV